MSPEAQRIAIAKACGWTLVGINVTAPVPVFSSSQLTGRTPEGYVQLVPNYLNDLNAMSEAEKVLRSYQAEEYVMQLASILLNEASRDLLTYEQTANWYNVFVLLNATASQRAEAFLRTLGKWVPGE